VTVFTVSGNLLLAKVTAREVGVIDLGAALELTALVAVHDRSRLGRFAARWLERYLTEVVPRIDEVLLAAGCLSALGDPRHAEALAALREVVQQPMLRRLRSRCRG
jgi:hypothetical protein